MLVTETQIGFGITEPAEILLATADFFAEMAELKAASDLRALLAAGGIGVEANGDKETQ